MPILLYVVFTLKEESREEALAAMRTVREATLQEKGCLVYRFATSFESPNVIDLFEEWESQEALDAHKVSQHLADFGTVVERVGGLVLRKFVSTEVWGN